VAFDSRVRWTQVVPFHFCWCLVENVESGAVPQNGIYLQYGEVPRSRKTTEPERSFPFKSPCEYLLSSHEVSPTFAPYSLIGSVAVDQRSPGDLSPRPLPLSLGSSSLVNHTCDGILCPIAGCSH
jgi:hypothetical protein